MIGWISEQRRVEECLRSSQGEIDPPTPQHKVDIIQPSDLSGLAARESAVPHAKAQGASDPIRPNHYDLGLGHGLEVMDLIRANAAGLTGFQGFAFGNILKYVLRFRRKNGLEDLLKAKTYLDQLIQSLQDASVTHDTARHSGPTHKTPQRPSQEVSAP